MIVIAELRKSHENWKRIWGSDVKKSPRERFLYCYFIKAQINDQIKPKGMQHRQNLVDCV